MSGYTGIKVHALTSGRNEKVAVRVYASAEAKERRPEELEIVIVEDTELEDRNTVVEDVAGQPVLLKRFALQTEQLTPAIKMTITSVILHGSLLTLSLALV